MIFAICFTNFGPYHLARLRAAGDVGWQRRGDCPIAYEMAGSERTYPWQRPEQRASRSTGSPCSRTASSKL